jgi:hypothetical protein
VYATYRNRKTKEIGGQLLFPVEPEKARRASCPDNIYFFSFVVKVQSTLPIIGSPGQITMLRRVLLRKLIVVTLFGEILRLSLNPKVQYCVDTE